VFGVFSVFAVWLSPRRIGIHDVDSYRLFVR
jgi:hypothetical protein